MKLCFLFFITLMFSLTQSLQAQTLESCEKKKINFQTLMKITSSTPDGKKAVFKEMTAPLVEDWSEASGEILSISLVSSEAISFVELSYVDKDKKVSNKLEFPVVNKKIENLIWKNVVGPNSSRQGEILLKVLNKKKEALCQKSINIHYADQLDR